MSADPLAALLEKLTSGDTAAAEQVFRSYEPYLRMVVRRQLPERLRAKLDSADIVQSAWADVLDGFRTAGWRFADVAHLRAFLVKVTGNRFLERLRQHRPALDRERPFGGADGEAAAPSGDPRPSEEAQANELWQQMLRLCPPAHRELLRLRRQGLSLAEVAARTGLHEGSVRRFLYDLEKRLAARQTATAPRPGPSW
jgi:RNA polymerase sigma-70 factor (ECF subfamily)